MKVYRWRYSLKPIQAVQVKSENEAEIKRLLGACPHRWKTECLYLQAANGPDEIPVPFGYWLVIVEDEPVTAINDGLFHVHFEEFDNKGESNEKHEGII